MKVLMFGWEFPPHISGGLGTACQGLTQGLSGCGADILFVLPRRKEGQESSHIRLVGVDEVTIAGVQSYLLNERMRCLAVDSTLQPYINDEQYLEQLRGGVGSDAARFAAQFGLTGDYGPFLLAEVDRYAHVAGMIAAHEPHDVIHAHDWMTYPAGVAAKENSGKPLVVHMHATEFDRSGDNINQNVYDIERHGMHKADKVIAVSHRTKDVVKERYGIPADKIEVVHNGVDKDRLFYKNEIPKHVDERIVLFLGRVTMQKGPDYFVEAANVVKRQIDNVRFVMAGSGDMLPRMIERMAYHRMLETFHFTGFLNRTAREKLFSMTELFVMPSVSEPFGIVPIEAMLYDIPVIISKQSGVSEVLPNAIKVDFWDVHQLADNIVNVLSDPDGTRENIEKNRMDLHAINWDNSARKVLSVYHQLAG